MSSFKPVSHGRHLFYSCHLAFPELFLKNKPHIFLTGFMGSGKSLIGKKLAPLFKYKFIDLDDEIEKKENCSIAMIFEKKGEKIFREIESSCLAGIIETEEPLVVSLGGGTICFGDNLNLVKQNGLLVFLEVPAQTLAERISHDKRERPLLKGLEGEGLLKAIESKLEERNRFYKQADITVNGLNLTPTILYQIIIASLEKNIS